MLEITFDAEDEEKKQKFIEISKKFSDAVTIHDNSGNVALLNEVEGNEIEGSSTDLMKTNIEVSEKDQKHSVKNEDKQKHKKTSVEKTLEFLYSNILKCQSSFVATVLQSLCNLSNDPSCESILRLHTVRLVLSLCEYAPSEMLRKEIIEHESEDEQRRRDPTNTKTDLSKEQETVSEMDDPNRAGAVLELFHVRPKKKISAILATLLEQLLAPQNDHDLLTVALQLTWSLLNKDLDYFHPEFLRRGIIEKVEVLHDQAPHSKSLISVCSGAILAMEIDDNDLADGLTLNSETGTPTSIFNSSDAPLSPFSPIQRKTLSRSSPEFVLSPGKSSVRDRSPSLKRLLRSGSSYDTLVYAVSELHEVCTGKPYEQLTEEESQEFDRAIATLSSTFTKNDFTAYELEQSNLEGLLDFVFNGDNDIGCTYIPYFSSAFGLSEESLILPDGNEEDEEDNMIEKKHRSGSKCGGIYGYHGGAFSKLINALQNSLAKDVEVSSSVGRMREKRDGTLCK